MKLPLGLVLGALLGAARAHDDLEARQNRATSSVSVSAPPPSTTDETTTTKPTSGDASPSGSPDTGRDVTVTSTIFVTSGSPSITTQWTTVFSTTTTVSTVFSTTTVTGNQATATSTIFQTSTVFVGDNRRRALVNDPPVVRVATPAHVEAVPTRAPVKEDDDSRDEGFFDGYVGDDDYDDQTAPRLNLLAKRATITELITSTVSGGERVTASATVTSFSLKTSVVTSVVTQTDQPNARTTVSVTSTLTVTSTGISSVIEGKPTAVSEGGGSSGDGLSAGAKAGIGIGAAIGALALIGAAALFLIRRRRGPKPDHDDFIGASEVPVGGPSGRRPGPSPMSESTSAGGYIPPSHSQRKPGPSVEGYRGTAMGDGRAAYANNLTPYGAAYAPPSRSTTLSQQQQQQHRDSMGGDNQLPHHPSPGDKSINPVSPDTAELGHDGAAAAAWNNPGAAEIDGQPVMGHQSGPVYEMPTQSYR